MTYHLPKKALALIKSTRRHRKRVDKDENMIASGGQQKVLCERLFDNDFVPKSGYHLSTSYPCSGLPGASDGTREQEASTRTDQGQKHGQVIGCCSCKQGISITGIVSIRSMYISPSFSPNEAAVPSKRTS